MAELVRVGRGRGTHYRATGNGLVPAGRPRCEVDADLNKHTAYTNLSPPRVESPVHDAPAGEPTCHWCRTRDLPE